MSRMVRTQVQFPQEEWSRLRRLAHQEGISVSELIRRCVARATDDAVSTRTTAYERAAALAGRFQDREASRDLSSRHDQYLGEAFE